MWTCAESCTALEYTGFLKRVLVMLYTRLILMLASCRHKAVPNSYCALLICHTVKDPQPSTQYESTPQWKHEIFGCKKNKIIILWDVTPRVYQQLRGESARLARCHSKKIFTCMLIPNVTHVTSLHITQYFVKFKHIGEVNTIDLDELHVMCHVLCLHDVSLW
jgi:hypothetical protein